MTVTKISLPRADIHQLVGGDPWPSGIFPDDIIDVVASIGHAGDSILVDGSYGNATIRLNVTQEVFGRQNVAWSAPHSIPYSEFYDRPVSSGLIEVQRTDIVVPSGVQFSISDAYFTDFKAVEVASGVRITFH